MKKLKRGSKSINNRALKCKYCYHWRKASLRDLKSGRRFCPPKDDWVKLETTACEQYKVSKYFWCDAENKFQTLNACENRREHIKNFSRIACIKCKDQAFEVDMVIMFAKEGMPKKVVKNKERAIKKIKRRVGNGKIKSKNSDRKRIRRLTRRSSS